MLSFTDVKSILESLTALVKKAAMLDLQEKIVELREYIISLKDENISLKEENQALKLQQEAEQNLSLKNGLFWKDGDKVPFCQKCHEGSRKRIHLQRYADGWKCFECTKYYAPEGQAGGVHIYRPDLKRRNPAV